MRPIRSSLILSANDEAIYDAMQAKKSNLFKRPNYFYQVSEYREFAEKRAANQGYPKSPEPPNPHGFQIAKRCKHPLPPSRLPPQNPYCPVCDARMYVDLLIAIRKAWVNSLNPRDSNSEESADDSTTGTLRKYLTAWRSVRVELSELQQKYETFSEVEMENHHPNVLEGAYSYSRALQCIESWLFTDSFGILDGSRQLTQIHTPAKVSQKNVRFTEDTDFDCGGRDNYSYQRCSVELESFGKVINPYYRPGSYFCFGILGWEDTSLMGDFFYNLEQAKVAITSSTDSTLYTDEWVVPHERKGPAIMNEDWDAIDRFVRGVYWNASKKGQKQFEKWCKKVDTLVVVKDENGDLDDVIFACEDEEDWFSWRSCLCWLPR